MKVWSDYMFQDYYKSKAKYYSDKIQRFNEKNFILSFNSWLGYIKHGNTYKLKNNLKGKLLTKLILPYKKDINDLTYEQFMSLPEVMV